MKILMIAPQPFFQPRGTPFSVLGRLRALSHLGHEIDLLTYHIGQNITIPGVTIFRTPAIPFIKDVPIGPSGVKLFLDVLLFARAFRQLQKSRYDLLHTHEEACFFGVLLAKYFRMPHLYDMHSSLPQQLKNFHYSHFRPLLALFERLEHWVITSSDALITICPALEEYVQKVNGHVPHVMIENVATDRSPASICEAELQSFKTAHDLTDGQKIVLYAGTFEPYQGLDLLIESAKHVLSERQDVQFLFVGGKPDQVRHYQNKVRDGGLSSYCRFTGSRPPQDIPFFIRLCHVLVSPRTEGTNTPLKIYAYLQSGKPIVATNLPTHTQVLNPEVAVLVEPNPDALARGLLSVLEVSHLTRDIGQQARQLFEERYSFATFIQKTNQVLQMVAG